MGICLTSCTLSLARAVLQIINPHTHRRYNVTREFCAAPCYASIYKRLLRDTLYKNPSLISVLAKQAPRAVRLVETPVSPTAAAKGTVTSSSGVEGDARREGPGVASAAVTSCAPVRSHPLPRGPGGIDIFNDPSVTPDPPPSLQGNENRDGSDPSKGKLGDEADAAAMAAAAMLGLGACASSSGREKLEQPGRVSGAGPIGGSGECRGAVLSNGYSERIVNRDREQQKQIEEGARRDDLVMENGTREHGWAKGFRDPPSPPLSPESEERLQVAAEEWDCKARAALPESVKGAMAEARHWQVKRNPCFDGEVLWGTISYGLVSV